MTRDGTTEGAGRTAPPPRLFGLVAERARRAVMLIRGPAGVTRAAVWNLDTDEVREGPPIRARVYERKCDISPNGFHLLYAAFGKGADLPVHGEGYTVIAAPPALTALSFLPMGTTYGGGGLFLSDSEVWIPGCGRPGARDRLDPRFRLAENRRPNSPPPALRELTFSTIHHRLLRDGWRMEGERYARTRGRLTLLKSFTERGEAHEVRDYSGAVSAHEDWEWAEFDGEDILYARQGGIVRRRRGVDATVCVFAPAGSEM